MIENLSRRNFLWGGGAGVSAVWLSAHWTAIVAAAEHAHQAAKSSTPPKFQFFTSEQAVEIDAITARIIPSDETPGAREAGVLYFIDRALTTFAVNDQETYREGLPGLPAPGRRLFPQHQKILRRHSRAARSSAAYFRRYSELRPRIPPQRHGPAVL